MNFSDFITHHGKRINKEHYLHLIQVSKADGEIDPAEMKMLHNEGRKFGLTDPEIDTLIKSEAEHNYNPPYSLKEKFDELYNIAEMILADHVVTDSERRMARKYAIAAGFRDDVIEDLLNLLLTGVAKGEDEEDLLDKYRKKYL